MKDKLKEYEQRMTEANFKLTSQRRLILRVLLENINEHLSAEEVYQLVRERNPRVGLATVYRTLELFCELGILHELNFDNNCRRYELEQGDYHHHHLICLKCGKIIEFSDYILKDLEGYIDREYNFDVVDHRIKFYGYCSDCRIESKD
ncbi:Fur family transcriptional regulator [Anoxybacter fermentans]|uniref:Fur family transcriptional regulator n=1 Tax=Anoxybacter fermentans TaxID=1323375 RepID=UPI001F396142|nr:Fur family transcriptional regulator [Anoxybacter fermentans]